MIARKAFPSFFAGALLVAPSFAFAQVIISEIAWMGTAVSANDEWIELQNSGSESVNFDGWMLVTGDGSIEVALSGDISAGGYYLLERTDDETVAGIVADAIYVGSLSNEGEALMLKDASGNIIDQVNMSSGWSAGENATKDTMQKVGAAWVTGIPTPKAQNSGTATPASESGVSSKSGGSSGSGVKSATPSSGAYSAHKNAAQASIAKEKGELQVSISRDRIIPAGSEAAFTASARDGSGEIKDAAFTWSWGDGTKSQGREASHIYKYPGEYVVALNVTSSGRTATARAGVKVFHSEISLALETQDGVRVLAIANNSPHEVNLGRFALQAGEKKFYFPEDTIIPSKQKLFLDEWTTGLSFSVTSLALVLHSGKSIVLSPFPAMNETLARVAGEAKNVESKVKVAALLERQEPSLAKDEQVPEVQPRVVEESVVVVKKPENIFMRILHFFFR